MTKNREELERLSKIFLSDIQITGTKDVFNIYYDNQYGIQHTYYPKCICEHFKIEDTAWPRRAFIGSPQNRCYCVRKTLEYSFSSEELEGCNIKAQCDKCYLFCVKNYFKKGGKIRLKKKCKS